MNSLKDLYRIGSGPSSSHTIGVEQACIYALSCIENVDKFKCILYGSLSLTGKGHFTDEIIKKTLGKDRTSVDFDYKTKTTHPNTFSIIGYLNNEEIYNHTFISVGGGDFLDNGKAINIYSSTYPFSTFNDFKEYCISNNIKPIDVIYKFEPDIKDYLSDVYDVMEDEIKRGISKDGYLPGSLKVKRKAKEIYDSIKDENDLKRLVVSYAYAVAEENASCNKIVTSPTCGSAGVLPSVLFAYKKVYKKSKDEIIDALAIAGIIGLTIKENASVSGADLGCQAEIGSACSMASAALAYLDHLSLEQIDCASEIAMEHHLGLTCDPVDGLVQIPCIERNAVAALRAFDAKDIASYPIYPEKLSFDSVVKTMASTGKDISNLYKETSLAGLAVSDIKRGDK